MYVLYVTLFFHLHHRCICKVTTVVFIPMEKKTTLIVWLHESLLYKSVIHFSRLNWVITIITLPIPKLSSRLEQQCQWFSPSHSIINLFFSGIKADLIILELLEEKPSLQMIRVSVSPPDCKWITQFRFLLNLLQAATCSSVLCSVMQKLFPACSAHLVSGRGCALHYFFKRLTRWGSVSLMMRCFILLPFPMPCWTFECRQHWKHPICIQEQLTKRPIISPLPVIWLWLKTISSRVIQYGRHVIALVTVYF